MQSTVKAIQLGAYEYLVKPIDIDRLRAVVKTRARRAASRATQLVELAARGAERRRDPRQEPVDPRRLEADRRGLDDARAGADHAASPAPARSSSPARSTTRRTPSATQPFVAVNCTALAPGVLESELFGHVKGAFTGAVADRPGRFELAGKGTLFLDEIAEIPLELQAKLLRVLQERTFERVGDAQADARSRRAIIAATHRDLAAMVAKGTFREDLYYRLRVVEIHLPPLRERAGDIPMLVEGLLAKIDARPRQGRSATSRRPRSRGSTAYAWPGNVRELENTLTRAVVLAKTDVLDETLLPLGSGRAATPRARRADADGELPTLREIERRHIIARARAAPSGTSAARARSSTSAGRRSIARSRSTACAQRRTTT